jgi:glutathione S-transferase
MKIFWAPQSRAARAVWMLEELGRQYEMEQVDIRAEHRRDNIEFRGASPMGKVPALIDGDVAMAESAAICLYLADRYSRGLLAPDLTDPRRGRFLYWLMYTPAVIEPAMSEKFNKVPPNRQRSGWGDFDLMIETWERGLGTDDWILGADFSAADVMLGSSAIFLSLFDMLPASPVLEAYAARCRSRPAYQRSQERVS